MTKSLSSIFKEFIEISYWKIKKFREGELRNSHYKTFYTSYFSLDDTFYIDKAILDIGCGPRGSLEWADMAKERIGLDPLVDKYLKLGAKNHKMTYVKAYSESLPFEDNHFDVICSFNSLDHVGDVKKTTQEISRTLKSGGIFLLIVDIHNYPTPTEPQSLKWDILDSHFKDFEILMEDRLESSKQGRIYSNARNKFPIDKKNAVNGLLVAKLRKK